MQIKNINEFKTREEARDYALTWQNWATEQNQIGEEPTLYMSDLLEWQELFTALAEKFDLTEEFSINGII